MRDFASPGELASFECPKCGMLPNKGDGHWYVEYHSATRWVCNSASGERIGEIEHLHVECGGCRYSFPMKTRDAA